MKYIKEVILKNFQSHKETQLEFVNGLNTIIGESDKGKSAVIRGIKWVLLNEPQGNGMVREGTSEASVSLLLNDGTKITRGKKLSGKKTITSKNTYTIEYPDGNISTNENFGGDVPQEVLNACGIKILKIDKDLTEIPNFSFQLEAPFLVSSNGAIRSKTIGKLINANLFDAAIRDIKNDVSDLGRKTKEKSKDYEILNEKLKEYDTLEEEEKNLKEIEKSITSYENIQSTIEKLNNYSFQLDRIQREKSKLKEVISILEPIDKGILSLKDLELKYREYKDLSKAQQTLTLLRQNKNMTKIVVDKLQNISPAEAIYAKLVANANHFSVASALKNKLEYIQEEKKKLNQVMDGFKNTENAERVYIHMKENKEKMDALSKLNHQLLLLQKEKTKLASSIHKLPDFENLETSYKHYIQMQEKIEKAIVLHENYKDTKERIQKGKAYLSQIEKELLSCTKAYSEKLKDMGKCPTCFSSIDHGTIQNIIRNMEV